MPDWLTTILDAADKFIVTPREQMEYDAAIARAKADETMAMAQIASAGQQNKLITTGLIAAVGIGVGVITLNMLKD